MQFVWLAVTLLTGGLQITAAVLFLRHRGAGPWMMLGGASLAVLIGIGHHSILFIANARNLWDDAGGISLHQVLTTVSLAGTFAHVLFAVGLVITAIRLRGISLHVENLESITETQYRR